MPLALVLRLRALSAGRLSEGSGPAVHGFWMRRWAQVSPAVFEQLHAGSTPPFSLSPLMDLPQLAGSPVHAGQSVWVRFCLLRDDLANEMEQAWLSDVSHVNIAGVDWEVEAVLRTPQEHRWAMQMDYATLIAASLDQPDPPNRWRLEFATPYTTKSGSNRYLPFPLPDSLLRSWWLRWNAAGNGSMAESLPAIPPPEDGFFARIRESLVVGAFELRTTRPMIGERGLVGCIGRLELRALDLMPDDRRLIDLLAHFAFFAGSGYKTTQGMGLTCLTG